MANVVLENTEIKNIQRYYENDQIFNKDSKFSFLTGDSWYVVKSYAHVFKNSYAVENNHNLDLCKFNLNQISEVVVELIPKTPASSYMYLSLISAYIDWSIKSFNNNSINPLDAVSIKEYAEQFVVKS
jgi:hypothetical protein